MPTYEYRCPEGHDFELFQRMSDEPVAKCPTCGKKAQRLLSAGGGLVFKGSGFYITDYRSDSYREAAKSEGGGGESGKEDAAAKGDGSGKADAAGKDAAGKKEGPASTGGAEGKDAPSGKKAESKSSAGPASDG
jgi:putative FmdB family regulatory protein